MSHRNGLEDVVQIHGAKSPVVEALRVLPTDILSGFKLDGVMEPRTRAYAESVPADGVIYIGETYRITIENSHLSLDVFASPIIRPPEEANDIYSIPPTSKHDSMGGISFKLGDRRFIFNYVIGGVGKKIVDENSAIDFADRTGKVFIDKDARYLK
jgi:hypothetical protein